MGGRASRLDPRATDSSDPIRSAIRAEYKDSLKGPPQAIAPRSASPPARMESLKESDEHRQMRRIAFVAIVVSTAAVIASVVTLPMLYNYVQSFQSHLIIETDYCKVYSGIFEVTVIC